MNNDTRTMEMNLILAMSRAHVVVEVGVFSKEPDVGYNSYAIPSEFI